MRSLRGVRQSSEKGEGQLTVEEFLKPVIDGVRDAERVRRKIPTQRLASREDPPLGLEVAAQDGGAIELSAYRLHHPEVVAVFFCVVVDNEAGVPRLPGLARRNAEG